jgi:hypothetical protein
LDADLEGFHLLLLAVHQHHVRGVHLPCFPAQCLASAPPPPRTGGGADGLCLQRDRGQSPKLTDPQVDRPPGARAHARKFKTRTLWTFTPSTLDVDTINLGRLHAPAHMLDGFADRAPREQGASTGNTAANVDTKTGAL